MTEAGKAAEIFESDPSEANLAERDRAYLAVSEHVDNLVSDIEDFVGEEDPSEEGSIGGWSGAYTKTPGESPPVSGDGRLAGGSSVGDGMLDAHDTELTRPTDPMKVEARFESGFDAVRLTLFSAPHSPVAPPKSFTVRYFMKRSALSNLRENPRAQAGVLPVSRCGERSNLAASTPERTPGVGRLPNNMVYGGIEHDKENAHEPTFTKGVTRRPRLPHDKVVCGPAAPARKR